MLLQFPTFAFRSWAKAALVVLLTSVPAAPVEAQVPTFAEVIGHDFGERITLHHQMARYLRVLEGVSDRVAVIDQGRSWEGRELLLAVVTSRENHARLDEIRDNAGRLADPRATDAAAAEAILADQPVVVWMGGSIHGFELSGSEAVLRLIETLTTDESPETREMLDNAVFLLDPMLNPDGRDSHAYQNHEDLGRVVDPSRDGWANDVTTWQALKFRTGHYYFDTNRDWFAHTQRETRARIPTLTAWAPQVVIDLHEQGPDVEFYFDPADLPYGEFFPEYARTGFDRFNESYAAAFDSAGFEYMTRERYNYFYPGYTTSYGSYQNAVGMLFEQGSTRGLAITRPDGTVRTLRDAIDQQYTAARAAARLAAAERESFLRDHRAAIEAGLADGRRGVRRYLIPADGGDPSRIRELANLLVRNGIEVHRLDEPTSLSDSRDRNGRDIGDREFPAGSFLVEAAQPRNRLVRVLLEPMVALDPEFLGLARGRLDRAENPRFYDITAWSLPLLFDVEGYSTPDGSSVRATRLEGEVDLSTVDIPRASYAYMIDGSNAYSLAVLKHLKDAGHRAWVTLRDVYLGGERFPRGTVAVLLGSQEESVHDAVRKWTAEYGVAVTPVGTGLGDIGSPSLGSADVVPIRTPNVALVGGEPMFGYSFGFAWWVLDRQYRIPHTVLRAESLSDTDLSEYDVLIVPEHFGLAGVLGEGGTERIRRWVQEGGTLITLGNATDWVVGTEMISLESWYEDEENVRAFDVPGAFFHGEADPNHWLTVGVGHATPVFVNSSRLMVAPEGPPTQRHQAVVTLRGGSEGLVSGHAWEETLERIGGTVFLWEERVGDGRVIAFSEDVNFRGYWRGSDRLFLNAVILGPSIP